MFNVRDKASWQNVDAVVFDLDGTLYDPKAIRWRMLMALGLHALKGPSAWRDLKIISRFRVLREELAEQEVDRISVEQYRATARDLNLSEDLVRQTITEWIYERPLPHLIKGRFAAVSKTFQHLRDSGRKIAVYSDYPVTDKLAALQLAAQLHVAAEDSAVDRLKPHAKGLLHTLEVLGVTPDRALMVGDRDDRDGEIARRAGVSYALKVRQRSEAHHFTSYEEWNMT